MSLLLTSKELRRHGDSGAGKKTPDPFWRPQIRSPQLLLGPLSLRERVGVRAATYRKALRAPEKTPDPFLVSSPNANRRLVAWVVKLHIPDQPR